MFRKGWIECPRGVCVFPKGGLRWVPRVRVECSMVGSKVPKGVWSKVLYNFRLGWIVKCVLIFGDDVGHVDIGRHMQSRLCWWGYWRWCQLSRDNCPGLTFSRSSGQFRVLVGGCSFVNPLLGGLVVGSLEWRVLQKSGYRCRPGIGADGTNGRCRWQGRLVRSCNKGIWIYTIVTPHI